MVTLGIRTSSTNFSSRGSARFRSGSSGLGRTLAEASICGGRSHRPPTIALLWSPRRSFSTVSRWLRSMKSTTFILDPHGGHSSGSTSNTRLTRVGPNSKRFCSIWPLRQIVPIDKSSVNSHFVTRRLFGENSLAAITEYLSIAANIGSRGFKETGPAGSYETHASR